MSREGFQNRDRSGCDTDSFTLVAEEKRGPVAPITVPRSPTQDLDQGRGLWYMWEVIHLGGKDTRTKKSKVLLKLLVIQRKDEIIKYQGPIIGL